MNIEFFVQKVKSRCQMMGISPSKACIESGAGKTLLDNVKRGRVPSVDSVQLLAQYLGVTTSELLGEIAPNIPTAPEPLAQDEQQLLRDYRGLSPQGQEYMRQTMHMAVQTYKKKGGG